MSTITDYHMTKKTVTGLHDQIEQIQRDAHKEVNRLKWDVYRPKIDKLENELRTKTAKVETDSEKKVQKAREEIERLCVLTKMVERTFALMAIAESEYSSRGSTKPTVFRYSSHDKEGNYISDKRKIFFEPVRTVYEDPCSIVQVFIVPNGKPVNKLSLIIRGYSIFGSLFKSRWASVNGINEDHCNIEINLKDSSTEKELLAWLDKNEKKVQQTIPEELPVLAVEYEKAKELMSDPEWQIAYLENRKLHYEREYHRGTELPEYKAVVKRLRSLKKAA